jgi:uroporphyrinogen-III synthase
MFLSARTAAVFCSLVIAAGIVDACTRMTAVAISRRVAQALRPAGFRQVVVAASPSRDDVLGAIRRLEAENA